jgi:hypothetical protein
MEIRHFPVTDLSQVERSASPGRCLMNKYLLLVALLVASLVPSTFQSSALTPGEISKSPYLAVGIPVTDGPITGGAVPTTGSQVQAPLATSPLGKFVTTVKNGQPGLVVGVYVPNILALKVAQQPANKPTYVFAKRDYATQFSIAAQYGTIGLLAHNYLSGALFFNLSSGQEVDVVYGDGNTRRYVVSNIRRFQALSPNDPYSAFIDLGNGSAQLSSTDVFNQIYAGVNKVVFQTCIKTNGKLSWGRLFVIATPTR